MTNVHTSGESLVQLITWNTKGMNITVKRGRILAHVKKLRADIAFLQETHLRSQDHVFLRRGWVGQVYHSHFQFKSRGAAILSKHVLLSVHGPFLSQGRYVMVEGELYDVLLILMRSTSMMINFSHPYGLQFLD